MNKTYHTQYGIGRVKYVVSFHDGVKTHKDGSPFSDVRLFKNKRKMESFVTSLKSNNFLSK